MKTPTHAQAKFYRRIANRKFGNDPKLNPSFGQPIPGELSEVERAHKVRRRVKHRVNLRVRKSKLESSFMATSEVQRREAGKDNNEAVMKSLTIELQRTRAGINRIEQSLERMETAHA